MKIASTPKSKRDLHPRAQLAYHQRCANRAQSKVEWLLELAERYDGDPNYAVDEREIRALRDKVNAHLRACVVLNDDHALGYPVDASMRRFLGMAS